MRLTPGDIAPPFVLPDLSGRRIALSEYTDRAVLLVFGRTAACTLCGVQRWYLAQHANRYQEQGLSIVMLFESAQEALQEYMGQQQPPFPVLADPNHQIYDLYGLTTSWRGVIRAAFARRAVSQEAKRLGLLTQPRWRRWRDQAGAPNRMPAEFLLTPGLRIHLAHYGKDSGDFLPLERIDEFLAANSLPVRAAAAMSQDGTA